LSTINTIILGIIQGVTEFLPVSSSGHLVIAEHLLPNWHQPGIVFEILLHLATLLAVVIFFRRDITMLAGAVLRPEPHTKDRRHLFFMLMLASIPTGIVGFFGKKFFTSVFNRLDLVGLMLLITALLLWLAEKRITPEKTVVDGKSALLIGTVQGLAILPGISRSGSTIAAAMLAGIAGESAARFSFLLSIPAITGAVLLNLKEISTLPPEQLPACLDGFAAALITGLMSLKLLLLIIKKRRLSFFAGYCLIAGIATLLLALS